MILLINSKYGWIWLDHVKSNFLARFQWRNPNLDAKKEISPVDRQDSDAGSEAASVNASGVNVSITEDPVSAVTWDAEMGAFQPGIFMGFVGIYHLVMPNIAMV